MRKTKVKMIILILLSNTVLFVFISAAFNTIVPEHFISDAEKTLRNEMEFMEREDYTSYHPTYLSNSISYFYIDSSNNIKSELYDFFDNKLPYQKDIESEKTEILEICSDLEMKTGECCTFRTQRSYLVLARVSQYYDENELSMLMYINIEPFLKYSYSLNWIICVLYLGISVIMCWIGIRTGNKIDEAHDFERRFFQNSSHELKTPLMSIQGYAEGIQLGIYNSAKGSDVILHESERMTKLVEELLCISRLDSDAFRLRIKNTDIREVLYESIYIAIPLAERKSCVLNTDNIESCVICCDEEQMTRALSNLIVNAVYHCNRNVDIQCVNERKNVVITVSNDGNPISEEVLPHIFERFYTGHKGGSGIGLSLAYEVVKKHKGKIEIFNCDGRVVCRVTLRKK